MQWKEVLEAAWKSLVVFILLVMLTRLIGKKLLAQLTFFDFVIGVTIGTIGGAYVVTSVQGVYVLLSPVFLTIAVISTGFVSLKSLRLRKWIEGSPVVMIQNGKILEKNLLRARYNLDDLEMQLRVQGVFDISQVEFAVLEPHGQLSVLKKSRHMPLTPSDVGLQTKYKGMPVELIKDGEVLEQNLEQVNLTLEWLDGQMKARGIEDRTKVVYACLSTDGKVYTDVRRDDLDYVQRVED